MKKQFLRKVKKVLENAKLILSGGAYSCECHRCIKENDLMGPSGILPLSAEKMILCPKCGNKRCPHASDHRLECTGSNERGQEGSVY